MVASLYEMKPLTHLIENLIFPADRPGERVREERKLARPGRGAEEDGVAFVLVGASASGGIPGLGRDDLRGRTHQHIGDRERFGEGGSGPKVHLHLHHRRRSATSASTIDLEPVV